MVVPPLFLALLAALVASHLTTTAWRGEAGVFVSAAADHSPFLSARSATGPSAEVQVAIGLARSPQLARRVVRAAALPRLTARQFLSDSSANARLDSVLTFSAANRQPALAVRLTNVYAIQFARFFSEQAKPSRQTRARPVLDRSSPLKLMATVVQPAGVPSSFRPHAPRNEFLAGIFGALLGVVLAVGVRVRRGSSS